MSAVEVSYHEATESARIEAVPLAHLSIETGHLYLEDFAEGNRVVREQFERTAPWIEAADRRVRKLFGRDARISTCFLIDDYTPSSRSLPTPAEVAELLTSTAKSYDFQINYLARESGCVTATDRPFAGARERSPLADIVAGLIVEEAAVGANGSRGPTAETGWLSNGKRSPAVAIAMDSPDWQPPEEFGKYRHSIFVDAELWRDDVDPENGEARRSYACSLLSAVWQLLRLGLVRNSGKAVAKPYLFAKEEVFPDAWDRLPTITQLTREAPPFAAFRTLSILPPRFRAAELAAEVIIDHLQFDEALLAHTAERARQEPHPLALPENPARRMSHIYLDEVLVLLEGV